MTTYETLRAAFAAEPTSTRPMMRWWWFGPEVDDAEVTRELTAMRDGGIGGAEVAYVYPLTEVSSGFLSQRFCASLRHAAETARRLGLRLDLTLGTGWSFGGPHVTGDLAARGLHWEPRELPPGPLAVPVAAGYPGDELVAAFLGDGSLQEAGPDPVRLEPHGGLLHVPDAPGPRYLLLAYSRLTGQNVKRAAWQGEGPVLDHYSQAATEAHLRAVGDPLLDAVPADLVGSVFCDSLEVYGSDWTSDLPLEFRRRRGYDLLPELWRLRVDTPGSLAVRADFYRTLTELYEERFVAVCRAWARRRGVPFRIQSYGTPPGTVSSYRHADLVEGEGWGWTDLTQARWASSAAHLYRHRVCSAEAWTWNHSPSLRSTPLDLQGEAHEHLLSGVNHLVGHGWPYRDPAAAGVGTLFYASGCYDDRNPWYAAAMPALTRYLGRLCAALQTGEPYADVTVLVPTQDVSWHLGRTIDLWAETRAHVGDDLVALLRTNGWDYDLVDDLVVEAPERERRVVLVPGATVLAERTVAWLARLAAAGTPVLLVDGTVEVPGARHVTRSGLVAALREVCPPDVAVTGPDGGPVPDVGAVHRRLADADLYLVANTSRHLRRVQVTPRTRPAAIEVWDARTGAVVRRVPAASIHLTLAPYEAALLVTRPEPAAYDETAGAEPAEPAAEVALGPWTAAIGDAGGVEVRLPHRWEATPGLERFCGTVTYAATFHLDQVPELLLLDLGDCPPAPDEDPEQQGMRGRSFRAEVLAPVGEVAEVTVNGQRCGVVWAPPYVVDVTAASREGANEVRVAVSGLAAHALADDPEVAARADAANARYGQRFRMQELHLADHGVRSGLLAVPRLRARPGHPA